MIFKLLAAALLLFSTFFVSAESFYKISEPDKIHLLGKDVLLLNDPDGELEIQDVIGHKGFTKSTETIPNLGVSACYWVKIPVQNLTSFQDFLLVIPYPIIDEVEFYYQDSTGLFKKNSTGDNLNFSTRVIKHHHFIFQISLPVNSVETFYLKVKSDEQIMLPVYIARGDLVDIQLLEEDLVFGLFFGILLVMGLYNFFIYLSVKDRSYLYYILYVFFIALTQASIFGYTSQYIFPEIPFLTNQALLISPALGGVLVILFASHFLGFKAYSPWWRKISNLIIAIYLISIPFTLAGYENISFRIIDFEAVMVGVFVIYVAVKISIKEGKRTAKYFLIGWLMVLTGFSLFSLRNLGILPYNNFTNYTMPIGIVLETIIFSLALADRINILKKENEEKQKQIIKHLQENEKYLIASKEAEILVERLKKESLDSQFESLKNQVNPHFLFNSLNVLSELINQNQSLAVKFVKELSDVYRYVLESKNKEVVDLNAELKFIDAFIYLLKIRYASSLIVQNNLKKSESITVPPLAIQLLLENAIKHNVISAKEPLTIELYHEEDYIVVRNNLNRKITIQKPSGIGIKNLESRYAYLTDNKVIIQAEDNYFTVKIPTLLFSD